MAKKEEMVEEGAQKKKSKAGFSRRHATDAAHKERQKTRKARMAAKVQGVVDRQKERDARTPEEQLAVLDERLGKGVGAIKERARLQAIIGDKIVVEAEEAAAHIVIEA